MIARLSILLKKGFSYLRLSLFCYLGTYQKETSDIQFKNGKIISITTTENQYESYFKFN